MFHDGECDLGVSLHPGDQLAAVTAVRPNQFQSAINFANFFEYQFGTVTILNVGGMHHDLEQEPEGVD